MKKRMTNIYFFLLFLALLALTACATQADNTTAEELANGEKLKIVATTTIVGDVVSQVGDDRIDLHVLLPVGVDPHGFNPTPQDISKVADADLVYANGAGLEEFLDNLIESAGAKDKVIHVSDGIDFLVFDDEEQENDHAGIEPHTWTDPNNVMVWVNNIEHNLSINDPENADFYKANAETYEAELQALDAWIRDQLARIPVEDRKLVTDHALFGYFVEEYGLIQVGALIAGYSTLAEPTAKELASIEDAIQDLNVKAVFVGNTVNSILAERITDDTGTDLIYVYTGSLSESGDEASTYIEYMRYNTSAFVDALAP